MSVLTVNEVADMLGFTPKTIRAWCHEGIFPGARKWPDNRPTAEWRIPRADVEQLRRDRDQAVPIPGDRLEALMDAALGAS